MSKATQTHCLHGHPFTGENVIFKPNGTRRCRACETDRNERRKAERAAARAARPPQVHYQTAKTHCPKGHPYDESNTIHRTDGGRHCATCRRTKAGVAEKRQPAPVRFFARVAVEGDCWIWKGQIKEEGYGQFADQDSTVIAHRWAYEHLVGRIPEGLHLDHLCRVRACVNPDHLEPVTPYENFIRGHSEPAKNARKTHCKEGHPLSGDNLVAYGKTGYRECRICRRRASVAYKRRRLARETAGAPGASPTSGTSSARAMTPDAPAAHHSPAAGAEGSTVFPAAA